MKLKSETSDKELVKKHISIRTRIIALIGGALAVSLLSYVSIGTSLIVDDKTSYIYDYNLSQVKAVSDSVDNKILKSLSFAHLVSSLVITNPSLDQSSLSSQLKSNHLTGLIILTSNQTAAPTIKANLGDSDAVSAFWHQLGWGLQSFDHRELLVSRGPSQGLIAVAAPLRQGQTLIGFYVCLIKLDENALPSTGEIRFDLFDHFGHSIISQDGRADAWKKEILNSKFDSGMKSALPGQPDLIVGYQGFLGNELVLLGSVTRDSAFSAARSLKYRSIGLGIFIFLLALGLTLLFANGLTKRLLQMWKATREVSSGNFSVRVDPGTGTQDEISDLSTSFNAMADKISELMIDTAKKAGFEKELETAKAVQKLLFPGTNFTHANAQVAGISFPASQCAGDWWHYAKLGNHLVVVIGDVTGHGVSAALVTAAVHGSFSTHIRHYQRAHQPPDIRALVNELNEAVYSAVRTEVSMTFLALVIDLESGKMEMVNASHCNPFVMQPAESKPLIDGKCAGLGIHAQLGDFTPLIVQLVPGDTVFAFTDGLFECTNQAGRHLNKKATLREITEEISKNATPDALCQFITENFLRLLDGAEKSDDVTVLVISIPRNASFVTYTGTLPPPFAREEITQKVS